MPRTYIIKTFYTSVVLTVAYLIFKIVLEEVVSERIKDDKTRYSMRRALSILYILVFIALTAYIWIVHTQTLIVSFGIIAAGVAITLQDFFKNLFGGVVLLVSGIYRVGDRIEVKEKRGDVIDVGILYTTLMETGGSGRANQTTGRLTTIPNGRVFSESIDNYTKDNNYIWDEIFLPISYDSDWKEAINVLMEIVTEETESISERAVSEMSKLESKYYLSDKRAKPNIFLKLTDNWIELHIRYLADVRKSGVLKKSLNNKILSVIEDHPEIEIATESLNIADFPELEIQDRDSKK